MQNAERATCYRKRRAAAPLGLSPGLCGPDDV
jgi:hypothetical protein